MSELLWKPGKFLTAQFYGVEEASGYLYKGLGMRKAISASPKGRRPPLWSLTHCGSGHRVMFIKAHDAEAFVIATEVADLGDWTFDGLEGWRNQFPDVQERIHQMRSKYGDKVSNGHGQRQEARAHEVAMMRT